MKKRILTTVLWATIFFVVFVALKYFFTGGDWLKESLDFVIPSTFGFFIGYGYGQDED